MNVGIYKIADVVLEIRSLYPDVQEMCRDYRSAESPEFVIETCMEDIAVERKKSAAENIREGLPVYHYPDGYLETLAVYRKLVIAVLPKNLMLFHCSAIAVDGKAYLFTAKSGTGKSTHTRLWRKKFGDRAFMVNDDKPLLKITDDGVWVYGTPWDGKHHLSTNTCVPVQAICILERDETNHIEPITQREAMGMLFQQSYRPSTEAELRKTLAMIGLLGSQVGLYRLGCNMDPEAADVAYEGMQ